MAESRKTIRRTGRQSRRAPSGPGEEPGRNLLDAVREFGAQARRSNADCQSVNEAEEQVKLRYNQGGE